MQDAQHPSAPAAPSADAVHQLARYLSVVGHPFVVLPTSVAAVSLLRGGDVRSGALQVFLVVSVLVVAGIKAGRFNDFDVSERERRPGFYLLVISGTAALAYWLRGDAGAVRACLSAGALLLVCGLVNRWIKASLHTAFSLYAAGFWAAWSPSAGLLVLTLAAAVAWSRIHLGRHTKAEVLVGAALGLVAALALLLPLG
jgi:membrane-associated phospholipid phosphatase